MVNVSENQGWKYIVKQVRYMRFVECFDKQYWRMEWNVVPQSEAEKILEFIQEDILTMTGVVRLESIPPAGNLTRMIQSWVDENVQKPPKESM